MIEGKNFARTTTPRLIDTEYRKCNFSQSQPIDVGGKKRGVRLFPGDDTPRTFIGCNMVNCEPPPGSTVIHCNTWIIERNVVTSTDSVTVDGITVSIDHHSDFVHSKYVDGEYIDQALTENVID